MTPFETALVKAARVHADQHRTGTAIPYIAHCLGVAAIALEYGASEDEAIAALLHDAVEDGGGEAMLAEIREQFGDLVGEIVLGCSDALAQDPGERPEWQARKEAALAHIEGASAAVCLVKAADQLHNIRAITRDFRDHGDSVWPRFNSGRDGTLWYHDAMARALWRRWPSSLTDDLGREVSALMELAARPAV